MRVTTSLPDETASVLLASASPRRRELLAALGVRFRWAAVEVDERPVEGEDGGETVRRLARLKLAAARALHADPVVLTADTVVELDGRVLGKPETPDRAVEMLHALRDREHLVHTALAIAWRGGDDVRLCTTTVRMRAYADEELHAYVLSGEPLDKAGSYTIQDPRFRPASAIRGPYSNVVGLPLEETARLLQLAGVPARYDPESESIPPWIDAQP